MNIEPQKQKILIVDDERALALLYQQRLIMEGYDVLYCDNGETALQNAKEFKPDLIVLDLMMPRLSGFDAIDLFRSTLETSVAKILILSALSQPQDIERAKQLGADEYLVKAQVGINDIISYINGLLRGNSDEPAGTAPTPSQSE